MKNKQYSQLIYQLDDLIKKEIEDNKTIQATIKSIHGNILDLSLEKSMDISFNSNIIVNRNPCRVIKTGTKKIQVKMMDNYPFKIGDQVSLHDTQKDVLINKINKVHNDLIDDDIFEMTRDTLNVLIYDKPSEYENIHYSNPKLNSNQQEAVKKSISTDKFHIIQGPPGSGKTHTIIEIINQLHKNNKKILITSHTHIAIDNILMKLEIPEEDILRIGEKSRINEEVYKYTIDEQIKNHEDYDQIRTRQELIKELEADENSTDVIINNHDEGILSKVIKRITGIKKTETIKHPNTGNNKEQIKEVNLEISQIKNSIKSQILKNVSIIASTVIASSSQLSDIDFDYIIMDEASQVPLYLALIPLFKTDKFIIIGDHKQLQPIYNDNASLLLNKSIFNLIIEKYPENYTFLNIQYRMNEKIANIASRLYYESKLLTDKSVKNNFLDIDSNNILVDNDPITYLDTSGVDFYESSTSGGCVNKWEANIVVNLIKILIDRGISPGNISVISPYRKQKQYIIKLLKKDNIRVIVDTVYRFQGKESDVIIMSFCKSTYYQLNNFQQRFLSNENQLNVSITRSRKKLIIIGDSTTINITDNIRRLLIEISPLNTIYLSDMF